LLQVAAEHGRVTLNSAHDLREVDRPDLAFDVIGHYAVFKVAHDIGSTANPDLNLETDVGELLEVRGNDLFVNQIGDVEIDVAVTRTAYVVTRGSITITNLAAGAGRVFAQAGRDTRIARLDAPSQGDVPL